MLEGSSIIELLARHATSEPDKLCLADRRLTLSYAQAWCCICHAAERLQRQVELGDYVLIECDQSADFLLGMLAAHLAGIVAVPLEKNVAEPRVREIAAETQAPCYIGKKQAAGAEDLLYIDIRTMSDGADEPFEGDVRFPTGDATAEILFSTGTTGKSKGIVISHAANVAIAENVICGVEMKANNVEAIPMPLSHSHGLRRSYANLANGSAVVVIDGVMALKRMFALMDEHHATSMDMSPSMLSAVFKLSRDRLGNYADVLDYVQLGSAPLDEETKARICRLLPKTRLYNFYGSTESGCACLLDFSKEDMPHCIGHPAVNAHFIVVDSERNPIESSPDNMGLLASSGSMNMDCYFKAPELTASAMENGFVYSQDLGYIDERGYVFVFGREDDVINYGGIKISPEEIESEVAKHPAIKDCACVPMPDPLAGQAPKLYIELQEGSNYDEQSFTAFLRKVIDASKQPKLVEVIDKIPRTYNGKIQRKKLV